MPRMSAESQLVKIRRAKADLEIKEKAILLKLQSDVISQIVKIATTNGISVEQIAAALQEGDSKMAKREPRKTGEGRRKVAPKYRNPANGEQTWTGRGKPPHWVLALRDSGALESALIK